jgi:porphobilinogen synthase
MRDGRVASIRQKFNENGFENIAIISYSTKFASNYYGAFREIYKSGINKNSSLQDRKTYQIDYRNKSDALLSSLRDEAEGADILMVKPIIRYLDIALAIKNQSNLPLCGFHVSSECVSLNLLASEDYATLPELFLEDWHAIKRSGVDLIISYNARMVKAWT